jgi:ABC-type sulfate transport system permease component
MRLAMQWLLMLILYGLGIILLFWSVFMFFYQYIAAIGMSGEVAKAFMNPRILSALWISLTSSFATAFLAILFGVPLAYVFAIKKFRGKTILETLTIDVPQTFPPVAEGIILLLMLGPESPFHVNIAYTYLALIFAKFFVSAPFVIAFTTRKFREVQETGLDVTAKTLGANEFQVFCTIFVPMAFKDIIAGSSLCWARAMGELGGSLIFAGVIPFKTEDIPTFIATNSAATAPALAATILVTTASIIALLSFKKITPGSGLWKVFFYRI